jgi:flavin reductase (DIM6/NTAB) family NADH-FMN oxidoreductase RutF
VIRATLAKAPGDVDIPEMDDAAKKTILRRFPYGLYAVTVAHGGDEHGMTANWVTQAAFEPPMVVVAVENTSKTIGMIRDAHYFVINLLASGQRELAGKLGRSSEQAPHKLKGIKTKPAPVSKTPVLAEAIGWVECRAVASLPSGDHTLFLGEIVEAGVENADGQPLTLAEAGFKYAG